MEASEKDTCQTCGYFRLHYIWRDGYWAIDFGHCVHPPRNRHCRPGMKACPKWVPQAEEYWRRYCPSE